MSSRNFNSRSHTWTAAILGLTLGLTAPNAAWAQSLEVIVEATDAAAQSAARAHIEAMGGTVRRAYLNVPVLAATLPLGVMPSLANQAGVVSVTKDARVELPEPAGRAPNLNVQGVGTFVTPLGATSPSALPTGYVNFMLTGADQIWSATGAGAGAVVAVVDTGTARNACIGHAVIGAPGFPEGFSSIDDGLLATSPFNHPHGTWVGGIVAAQCGLAVPPTDPFWLAVDTYLPGVFPTGTIPILGQAPLAQLYPVKVLDSDGGGSASSVLAGLDHVLSLKRSGALDVDVINLSLGFDSLDDRRGPFARMITTLHDANVLVVTAAGNSGPGPASVAAPAVELDSISVGAIDHAIPSRVAYEFIGYAIMAGPGQGLIMRPTAETRVASFSSRGPTADGRSGPDLVALGTWSVVAGPDDLISLVSGTSGASPTVAGAAALLVAYHEGAFGTDADAEALRRALMSSADPYAVGPQWQSPWAQGNGLLDAPAALAALQSGNLPASTIHAGQLHRTALPPAGRNRTHTQDLGMFTLAPGVSEDIVIEVNQFTDRVVIEMTQAQAPNNAAVAFWPNVIDLTVRSARRSTPLWDELHMSFDPNLFGPNATLTIEDGAWSANGSLVSTAPMQPGLMKLTVAGDFSNGDPVSLALRVTRSGNRQPLRHPVAAAPIRTGDEHVYVVDVAPNTAETVFDLAFNRDWSSHPTSDVDMIVISPDFSVIDFSGASLNAPERSTIQDPMAGPWLVVVLGYELSRPDRYELFVTHR